MTEALSPMEAAAEVCCGEFEKLMPDGQAQVALHVRLLTIAGLHAVAQGLDPEVLLTAFVKMALNDIADQTQLPN